MTEDLTLLALIGEYGSGVAAVVSLLGAAAVMFLTSRFARRKEFEDLKKRVGENEGLTREVLARLTAMDGKLDSRLDAMDRNMDARLKELSEKVAWRFESLERQVTILLRGHLSCERDH